MRMRHKFITNESTFDTAILLFSLGALGVFTHSFLSIVNIAPELSDSAFYILNSQQPENISNLLTGFGVLVSAFSFTEDIVLLRIFMFIILLAAPISLVFSYYKLQRKQFDLSFVLISAVVGISSIAGCSRFLIDPNYNNILLPLLYLSVALALQLYHQLLLLEEEYKRNKTFIIAVCFAIVVFCMLYTKITAFAAFTVFFFLPLFGIALANNRGSLRFLVSRVLTLIAAGALGLILLLSWIWIRVLPPWEIFDRFFIGYQGAQIMTGEKSLFGKKLVQNINTYIELSINHLIWTIISTTPIMIFIFLRNKQKEIRSPFKIILFTILATLPLAYCLLKLKGAMLPLSIFVFQFSLFIALFICVMERRNRVDYLLILAAASGPFTMSFGTSNSLHTHMTMYAGLPLAALLVVVNSERINRSVLILAASFCAIVIAHTTFINGYQKPYRMLGSIDTAIHYVTANGQRFITSEKIAKSYNDAEILMQHPKFTELSSNPLLLDVSGRAPLLHWITGMRLPGVPWTLSGYPGSNEFFRWAVKNHVTQEELKQSWLLVDRPNDEGDRYGININTLNNQLNAVGLVFPADYTKIGDFHIAYKSMIADLYAPNKN